MDDSIAPPLSSAQTTQLLLSASNASVDYDQVLRLVGQNVSAMLIEQGPDGVKLELPSGQIISAKGDLPFPEQTQLKLKISVQDGLIQIKTLEALPPSPASILGPLLQSEAHALIQHFQALKMPEAIAPLAKLFNALLPSSEFQLQQAIEALPIPAQRLLYSLFGLNTNNSTIFLHTLLEEFEPIISLLDMNFIFTDKRSNDLYLPIDIDQKSNNGISYTSNYLYRLLSKYLESNSINYTKAADINKTEQIDSLVKLVVSELLPDMASLRIGSAQISVVETDKVNQLEKILQVLKLLPDEVRNNISDSALMRPAPDIGTLLKAISNELRNSVSNIIGDLNPDIEAIAKLISKEVLANITNNFSIKANPNIEAIAKFISEKLCANITNTFSGKANSDIEVIAKVISDEIRSNITNNISIKNNLNTEDITKVISNEVMGSVTNSIPHRANSDIEVITKMISDEIRSNIANSISAKTSPDIEAIAKVFPNELNNIIPENVSAKSDPDIEILAKAILEKIGINSKEVIAASKEKLPVDATKQFDRQKLIQILESMSYSEKKLLASVFLGSADTESKAIAEYFTQKDIASNSKQLFSLIQETSIPALRQIISYLTTDAKNNISNIILATDKFNIKTIAKALFEKPDIKDKTFIAVSRENISGDPNEKPSSQKLIQVLENIHLPIKRAIASAVLGNVEAEAKFIADFLIQKGNSLTNEQNFISKLETVSPVLRQIISLIAELKPDAPLQQTIQTLLNGDKGVLTAAKGLLLLNEDTSVTSTKSNFDTHAKEAANHSVLLATRLNYLLRFEMLNSQAPFSSQEKNTISSWFRSIVDQFIMAKTIKLEMPLARQTVGPHNSETISNTSRTPASGFEHVLRQDSAVIGGKAQTWQMWMKGSMEALTDPTISAKEAIFHTLAAKENINYFELPLPWMPGRTLEMWVEVDKGSHNRDRENSAHRVLLALNFSELGETRVGLESIAKRLNIRVWAEHPKLIEKELSQIEDEISALGFAVRVSLHNLTVDQNGLIPTIKSILSASSLHAMG